MTPAGRGRTRHGLVRPYAATGGAARPTRQSLDVATLLRLLEPPEQAPSLDFAAAEVLAGCRSLADQGMEWPSVAEVAATIGSSMVAVLVLADRLVDAGLLAHRQPVPAHSENPEFLNQLLEALRAFE